MTKAKANGKSNDHAKSNTKQSVELVLPPKEPKLSAEGKPFHVAIVALGPSSQSWAHFCEMHGGRSHYCDEVWTVNTYGDVIQHDMLWHMDDVRIQEIRAAADPNGKVAKMLQWMKKHPGPIMTSRAHPDYPGLVEFPIEDVINATGAAYFNSTTAYAIAYAIYKRATKLTLFGMDFTYPNAHVAEKGRGCCEFWVGQAMARGTQLAVCDKSTFMDANIPESEKFYGYDTLDVKVDVIDGKAKVAFQAKDTLPTAAEIEDKYDHTKHPSMPNAPAIPHLVEPRQTPSAPL